MIGSVTACLVTRGDQPKMMERIHESLIFEHVVVWDNSEREEDCKVAGRYRAAFEAPTDVVYFQDDDVIVPRETQAALLEEFERQGCMVANWGHGENPDGYDDLPLVGGGAVVNRNDCIEALARYQRHYALDEGFLYEADFVLGVLYDRFVHLWLPFEINMAVAQHPSRLVNQPWQKDLKFDMTQRARAIRDGMVKAA